jgi:hypothetical protein
LRFVDGGDAVQLFRSLDIYGNPADLLNEIKPPDRDEETIRAYIRNQELQDKQLDQLLLIP